MKPRPFSTRRATIPLLLAGSACVWHGTAMGQPASLYLHSAIYDPVRQRMLVFGGSPGSGWSNETWQLSLTPTLQWAPLTTSGGPPSKRIRHAAVYDPVRDRMLVFGGLDSGGTAVLNDVWALSLAGPATWSRLQPLQPAGAPAARQYTSAVYDGLRDRMVIYGGSSRLGQPFGDVWGVRLAPSPQWEPIAVTGPARFAHSAILDPARDRLVVFGGGAPASNEVWQFSLGDTAWTQLQPPGDRPAARLGHTAVYDPGGDRMIVFGGNDATVTWNDVWRLALTGPPSWSLLTDVGPRGSPSPRTNHSAIYDPIYPRMVVFGGSPSALEPTWALSLGQTMQWGPFKPAIDVSPLSLALPTVTVGDTVRVPLTVSNIGMEPLLVTELKQSVSGMRLSTPAPLALAWSEAVTETLILAATAPGSTPDSLVIVSSDPVFPRTSVGLTLDVRGLDFNARVLGAPVEAPLGVAFIVVVTPQTGVRIERGTLFFRVAGASDAFDSRPLTPLSTDFIAAVPASSVTERGVEYYVEVRNSGEAAMQPPDAPSAVFTQPVAAPASMTAVPRPTSGEDFLEGRAIEVEAILPAGAVFVSGALHCRRGGEPGDQAVPLALNVLGRPVATIPDTIASSRGVEYWVGVETLRSTLRYPAAGPTPAIITTKVQNLVEDMEHRGTRYRVLSVPLDFGGDFFLDALLTDQFGLYDPVRWRAFSYDPTSRRNVEFTPGANRFRLRPGRAFWLISRNAHRVDTNPIPGFSTPTRAAYEIELESGWNLLGNPFDFPVAWADVQSDASAVDGGPDAYDPASAGNYTTASLLVPFEGYFIHANQATTLRVPPRAAVGSTAPEAASSPGGPPRSPVVPAGGETQDLWRFSARVRTESDADGAIEFGVHPAAMPGPDPRDRRKPPPPPGSRVRAAIVHDDWATRSGEYRCDMRGPGSDGETWEIEVRSESPGDPVTVELSEAVPGPPGLVVRLIDREQGSSADWTSQSTASVAGPARPGTVESAGLNPLQYRLLAFGDQSYRLAIAAGTADYVAAATREALATPARLALDPGAPNPFRVATRIRFGLPHAESVTLEIYNVLGQRVARLVDRTSMPPGYHTAVWDGREPGGRTAPSGVYLMRLSAGRDVLTRRIVRIQ